MITHTDTGIQHPRLLSWVSLEVWLSLGTTLLTSLLLKHGWSPFDDGVYLWGARRVLDGAVIHRDLYVQHSGYSLYVDAWLFSNFGSEFSVLRYPLPLLAGALTAAITRLLRPAGTIVQCAAAFAAASLGIVQFITPSPGWFAVTLAAVAIAIFHEAATARERLAWKWLLLTGLLVGLCAGFRQLNGALLGAALVILHALLVKPGVVAAALPRVWQAISLLAILTALGLMAMPAIAAPSVSVWLYSLPAVLCAVLALKAWKEKPHARDPQWLWPVAAGCVLGFLPAMAIPMAHGALSDFVTNAVVGAAAYNDYSTLRGVDFGLTFADAIDLLAHGGALAYANAAYLVIVGLMPLIFLTLVCWRRDALTGHTAAIVVLAAICLPINIAFQGLIYTSYWLPAVLAAVLAFAASAGALVRKLAAASITLLAAFGLFFLSGRIPGSHLFELLSEPRYQQVACSLPHCNLYVDRHQLENMTQDYRDILANVPADRPLMLLPDGASLYGSLPHPSPWSVSFVIKGLSGDDQIRKLKVEFLAQPDAVLAVDRDYSSEPGQATEFDRFIGSLCPMSRTSRYDFYMACPG